MYDINLKLMTYQSTIVSSYCHCINIIYGKNYAMTNNMITILSLKVTE